MQEFVACTGIASIVRVLFHDVYQFNGVFWLESDRYFSRAEFLKITIGSRYSEIRNADRSIEIP